MDRTRQATMAPGTGSARLFRISGVDFYIHLTFLLLLAVFSLFQGWLSSSIRDAFEGFSFFLLVVASVLVHELGHLVASSGMGMRTRHVTLFPFGGVAHHENAPKDLTQELRFAISGPAVNLFILACSAGVLVGIDGRSWSSLGQIHRGVPDQLVLINGVLILLNLIPLPPFDAGRIVRVFLAKRIPRASAARITVGFGKGFAVGFFVLALCWWQAAILILLALSLWLAVGLEARELKQWTSPMCDPVASAMATEFRHLSPDDTLSSVVSWAMGGEQRDFPVLKQGRVLGMLTRGDLFRGLSLQGPWAPVSSVMRSDVLALAPASPMKSAIACYRDSPWATIPVTEDGFLVGLLTRDRLMERLQMDSSPAR